MKFASGFTVIEVLITIFIIGTVVVGVFGLFVLGIRTNFENERRIAAVALANERAEMIRNLPYADVGTVGGVPQGSIAQEEEISRNGLTYSVRTDIRYVDDPYDGQQAGSSQGGEQITICHKPGTSAEATITVGAPAWPAHEAHGDYQGACGAGGEGSGSGDFYNADYKQARIEVSWSTQLSVPPILLITYVTPDGIEGGEGLGTLDFLVLDSFGEGVPSATVDLANDTINPPVSLTTQTDEFGNLVLPGLVAASDSYELAVTKADYTFEQTYDVSPTFVPDANHAHLTILEGEVFQKTFVIDRVASLTLHTKNGAGLPLPNVSYTIRGTKTIGVDETSALVYVLNETSSTDGAGNVSYTSLVWDSYDVTIDGEATGYDIKETSLVLPAVVNPGDDLDLDVVLVPHTLISLHITVVSLEGDPIDNATVALTGTGYDETQGTGVFGQVLFSDLPFEGSYTLSVNAPGYEAHLEQVDVEGTDRAKVEVTPSG